MYPTDESKTPAVTIEWDKNERQRARNRINQRNYRRRKSEQAKENEKKRVKSTSRSPGTPSLSAPEYSQEEADLVSHDGSPGALFQYGLSTSPWPMSTSDRATSLDPLMLHSDLLSGESSRQGTWDSLEPSHINSEDNIPGHLIDSEDWENASVLRRQLEAAGLPDHLSHPAWSTVTSSTLHAPRSDVSSSSTGKGKTTLHLAAENGHIQSIKVLLSYGADPNLRDSDGCTALHTAAQQGHQDVIAELIKAGCDVNRTNFVGRSALHLAAENNHAEIIDQLLRAGGDPNIQISDS